jgi:hypothetical protein
VTRIPVTDAVVEQLRDVLASDDLDDEYNYVGARIVARDRGHDELARFVDEADAATYYEAVQRAKAASDGEAD